MKTATRSNLLAMASLILLSSMLLCSELGIVHAREKTDHLDGRGKIRDILLKPDVLDERVKRSGTRN